MKYIKNVDKRTYDSIHRWLRKNYGKADRCESKECEGKSNYYNWALRSDKDYDYKRENFVRLCRSCHSKQDITEEGKKRTSEALTGVTKYKKVPFTCRVCGKEVDVAVNSRVYCRDCSEEGYQEVREKWLEDNKEKMREYHRVWARNYRKKNREKMRKYYRDRSRRLNNIKKENYIIKDE